MKFYTVQYTKMHPKLILSCMKKSKHPYQIHSSCSSIRNGEDTSSGQSEGKLEMIGTGAKTVPSEHKRIVGVEHTTQQNEPLKPLLNDKAGDDNNVNGENGERQDNQKQGDVIVIGFPRRHDILSGRGNGVQNHPGNLYFRQLIKLGVEVYAKATKTHEKKKIVGHVIRTAQAKGCRFLKPSEFRGGTISWTLLSEYEVRKKIAQALRDMKGDIDIDGPDEIEIIDEKRRSEEDQIEIERSNIDGENFVEGYFSLIPPKTPSHTFEKEAIQKNDEATCSNNQGASNGTKQILPLRPINPSNYSMVPHQKQKIMLIKRDLDNTQKCLNLLKRKQEVLEKKQMTLVRRLVDEVELLTNQTSKRFDNPPNLYRDGGCDNRMHKMLRLH